MPTKCPLQIGACLGAVRPCGGYAGPGDRDPSIYRHQNPDYSPDERCSDGLDNDCDGVADEHPADPELSACGECPHDMVFVPVGEERWCVDRWEASKHRDTPARPASAANASPWVNISFNDVTTACALASFGRRGTKQVCPICVWTRACRADGAAYPYGGELQPDNCNGEGTDVEATGVRGGCVSAWPDRPGALAPAVPAPSHS